ncbi:ChrR family anti-sigma-E factor [Thalassotalea marina]|uniref:Anti-ECF sigma factor ChrR n=1 Tax=Thalassotalea marina TaxID=1673741 RepID=A0A919BQI5_9GAMM|nr:ChrR family anti-sigma-E factor [Thalassotalea marina]GHG03068.1 anti-ECF sigma factor ChrR [Thalassotalea marina]
MIKHHPSQELLQAFVNGELPASLSAGVAIHADMCPACQANIANLTEQAAENSFEQAFLHQFVVDESDDISDIDFDRMFEEITQTDDLASVTPSQAKFVTLKGKEYKLPKQLQHMEFASPMNLGKLARSRINLGEGEIHSSLLHIDPGGSVPQHTHHGYELTLLLEGSFSDDMGEYHVGDFILLDQNHDHSPVSENGCLCFTVANDALHFTKGFNKLLNPFGSLIY